MSKKISLFSLVLLVIAAIDSIRNLPAAALFGSELIFFFIFAALIFLIPTSLIAAELSATFPEKGGVYHWVQMAFGEKTGMLAIWLQWINTMVWYPTILSFIAGTLAYLVNPALAEHKGYIAAVVLSVFWGLTFVNLFGLRISAKINSICVLIGTVFPMFALIFLGIFWAVSGEPLQISITFGSILPSFKSSTSWVSLIAIMASYLGMELSGVHIKEIDSPQRNFPKAIFISCAFILTTMILGSLAIAFVLPDSEINLVSGVMQVFANFFSVFHMEWCLMPLTFLVVIGTVGSIINWLISPAKGLLHASEFGFMPPFFSKKNRYGVPSRIMIAQGVFVSLFCLLFLLVPSVNSFYWFLTALSTCLYMLMYILMFLSGLILHYKHHDRPAVFKIPGNNLGIWTTCLLGLFACALTIFVGFFPPEEIHIESIKTYSTMIGIGLISLLLPVLLFYGYRAKRRV
ncbi:MAG: APC family permease [Candidatus Algichlamydia australiensis]|nr:APC family permease [Chlamydiales bacterium]